MLTHIITRKWSSGNSTLSKAETVEADGETNRDVNVYDGLTNLIISYDVLIAKLRSIFMVSSQDITITPYDDVGSPMTPINLEANIPYLWTAASGIPVPFADDIGALHAANSSGSDALFSLRTLFDSTASNPVVS